MIIACPNCATKFDVGNVVFPPAGKRVKCARCSHVWLHGMASEPRPQAEGPVAEAALPVAAGPAAAIEAAESPPAFRHQPSDDAPPEMIWAGSDIPRRGRSRGTLIAVAVAAFAVVVAGAIVFREAIARAMPGTGPIYAALGFDINVVGIEFRRIEYSWSQEDGVKTLAVTGEIVNVTGEERPVPKIRVALRGQGDEELHAWTFEAGVPSLHAGEVHAFREVLAKPPSDAAALEVRFADSSE